MLKTKGVVLMAMLIVVSTTLALVCTGCHGPPVRGEQMTTNQAAMVDTSASLKSHADSATDHNGKVFDWIGKAMALVKQIPAAQPVEEPLANAGVEVGEVQRELRAVTATAALLQSHIDTQNKLVTAVSEKNADLVATNLRLEKEKASLVADVKAARDKYNNAWLGGKTVFWLTTISITAGLLIIGLLILNAKTNLLVATLQFIGWLVKPAD